MSKHLWSKGSFLVLKNRKADSKEPVILPDTCEDLFYQMVRRLAGMDE
ncbi:hypothetical protein AALB81_10470 [Lachnospiraceae bacterium 48-33]